MSKLVCMRLICRWVCGCAPVCLGKQIVCGFVCPCKEETLVQSRCTYKRTLTHTHTYVHTYKRTHMYLGPFDVIESWLNLFAGKSSGNHIVPAACSYVCSHVCGGRFGYGKLLISRLRFHLCFIWFQLPHPPHIARFRKHTRGNSVFDSFLFNFNTITHIRTQVEENRLIVYIQIFC